MALWDVISPVIANTLAIILTGVITWVANTVRQKYNIEIEQSYRESLHKALMSGINAALLRVGGLVEPLPPGTKVEVINQAVAHAQKSVPDAIKTLGATTDVLGNLATSKLNMVATEQQMQQPIVVQPATAIAVPVEVQPS